MLKGGESDESSQDEESIIPGLPAGYSSAIHEDENINQQIEQYNKSRKEEKMLEKLEKLMNENCIIMDPDGKLYENLRRKEYFNLLCNLIGKPHIYQSEISVFL